MDQKIITTLIKYGLLETEARVYCAALALDGTSVDKIAKNAGVNRTSCYPVLERLENLGLVSQVKKKGKTLFMAVSPKKFLELADEKRETIESIIPDMNSLFEISRGRPSVRYYEGSEGLKTVLNMILSEAKEIFIFGEADSFIKAIPSWTESYVAKRAKKNIRIKMILKASPFAVNSIKKIRASNEQVNKLIKVRMLPEAYKINYSGFDIYNNKLVLYSFEKQNNAVVIENKLINQMMRTVFDILWETSEKYEHLMK